MNNIPSNNKILTVGWDSRLIIPICLEVQKKN